MDKFIGFDIDHKHTLSVTPCNALPFLDRPPSTHSERRVQAVPIIK